MTTEFGGLQAYFEQSCTKIYNFFKNSEVCPIRSNLFTCLIVRQLVMFLASWLSTRLHLGLVYMEKSCQPPSCANFSKRSYDKKVAPLNRVKGWPSQFWLSGDWEEYFQTFNMVDLRKLVLAVSILSSLMIALLLAAQMLSLYLLQLQRW